MKGKGEDASGGRKRVYENAACPDFRAREWKIRESLTAAQL